MPTQFTADGALAPGTYPLTLAELRASLLVRGPEPALEHWDGTWRTHLVSQLELLCGDLWQQGISEIVIDGSFCTDKLRPGDIDGYFVTDFTAWRTSQASALEKVRSVWTWDRRAMSPDPSGKPKLPMWHQHRVELFPVFKPPFRPFSTRGHGATLIDDFFKHGRDKKPRGVVQVVQ